MSDAPGDQPTILRPVTPGTEPTVTPGGGRPPSPAPSDLSAGRPFGRYLLLQELGHGGMGIVWKAYDTQLARVVALKQVLSAPDPDQVERFMREAKAAARLRHPHIVAVHDVGCIDGRHYLTTDLVDGGSLDEATLPLPPRRAAELVRSVAEALSYAHEQGILHRDVKPANILLDTKGEPFVMDFGLARDLRHELGESLTVSGQILGTPAFMSPEQARGEVGALGPASDQFSLGSVLYRLLTGRLPFEGSVLMDILVAVSAREPVRPSRVNRKVPRDLETVCAKAMEKDPARRYASMGAFAEDLGRWLDGEAIQARPVTATERILRKARKHRSVVVPSAAATLLAAAVLGWLGWKRHEALGANAELRRRNDALRSETASARASSAAQDEAVKLLEAGRLALDQALHYLRGRDATREGLTRRVAAGREEIERALARSPGLALGHFLLGRAWEMEGWDDKAEACWRKAIELDPSFGPPHVSRGRLLLVRAWLAGTAHNRRSRKADPEEQARLSAEAAREFEAARGRTGFDDALQPLAADAMLSLARRDAESARRIADDGIRTFEGSDGVEELHFLRALTCQGEDAIRALDAAIERRPKYALALFVRGILQDDAKRRDAAIADYTKAIEINPRFAEAWLNRGVAHSEKGEMKDAIADDSKALDLDPCYLTALRDRAYARLELGDVEGAIADCTKAIDADPRFEAAFSERALAFLKKGDWEAAMGDCTRALALDPRDADALVGRGMARAEKGDLEGALADDTEATKADPRHAVAFVNRADVRARKGDFAGAVDDLTKAIALDPRDAESLRRRAEARFRSGDPQGAREDCREALRVAPSDWPYRAETENNLAELERMMGTAPSWVMELRAAEQAVARGEYGSAGAQYERGLQQAPAGAEKDAATRELLHGAHYNLACIRALASAGRDGPNANARPIDVDAAARLREEAFRHLRQAIALGHVDRAHLAADADLVPLHDDARWAQILDSLGR